MAGAQQQNFVDGNADSQTADLGLPKDLSKSDDEGKLFVGGISHETTSEKLREYMQKFGDVEAAEIKMDPNTQHSRGFGFVKFADPACAELVCSHPEPHILDGKAIDPKKALPMGKNPTMRTKKIFVGGLKQETTEEKLREYFELHAVVTSIEFVVDPESKRKRGFCFIELDSEDKVDELVKTQFHTIAGKTLEVKYAFSKEQQAQLGRGRGRGRGRGGGPGEMFGSGGFGGGYGGHGVGHYGGYQQMGGYGEYGAGSFGGFGRGGYGEAAFGAGFGGAFGGSYGGAYGGGYGYGAAAGMRDVRYPGIGRGRGPNGLGPMSSHPRDSYHPYAR